MFYMLYLTVYYIYIILIIYNSILCTTYFLHSLLSKLYQSWPSKYIKDVVSEIKKVTKS